MSEIKHTYRRVICTIDLSYKDSHDFEGHKIDLKRGVENFDRKYTQPVNAIVIDSDYIPTGAEILCHHNASHVVYKIQDLQEINGKEISDNTKYYSLPDTQIYAWRIDGGEWQPTEGYELALRVFKPYTGFLSHIPPTIQKQRLFILTGTHKNKCVVTLKNSDYQIIYQDKNGKENTLIRCRYSTKEGERNEIIGIDHEVTKAIISSKYKIGFTVNDCKTLTELV